MTTFYMNNLGKVSLSLLINAASMCGVICVLTDCHTLIVCRPHLSARVHIIFLNYPSGARFIHFGPNYAKKNSNNKKKERGFSPVSLDRTKNIPEMLREALRSGGVSERLSKVKQRTTQFPH